MEGSFDMQLPLHGSSAGPEIEGSARLAGVRAAMPEWDLALDTLRGSLEYDEHGFLAPRLGAWQSGQPGVLTLRAGSGHVLVEGHAFEGELRVGLEAGELLERAPQLDWLRPHVDGRSAWSVGVEVPRDGGGPAQLLLESDLVGTRLELPEPLSKAPAVPLTARIRVPLPLGEGDIGVQLGQRVALRARAGDGPPAVRVLLGAGEVQAPAGGLVIEGRTPELAVMEWAGLVAAGTGSEGGEETTADPGLPLREVDVQVDRLLVGGGSVHLANGTGEADAQLRFDGAAMAGTLTLPKSGGDALSGHFERLHWQRPEPGARTHAGSNEDDAVPGEGPDPALIPPIRISV